MVVKGKNIIKIEIALATRIIKNFAGSCFRFFRQDAAIDQSSGHKNEISE
jgi:hypothetical protein